MLFDTLWLLLFSHYNNVRMTSTKNIRHSSCSQKEEQSQVETEQKGTEIHGERTPTVNQPEKKGQHRPLWFYIFQYSKKQFQGDGLTSKVAQLIKVLQKVPIFRLRSKTWQNSIMMKSFGAAAATNNHCEFNSWFRKNKNVDVKMSQF